MSPQHAAASSNPILSGGPCVPEPIQSAGKNVCEYDPSQQMSIAPPAPPSPAPLESRQPPEPPPAVTQLVNKHTATAAAGHCTKEGAALAAASGQLLRSTAAMTVATPTVVAALPAVASFIGSAILVGATAAAYLNCRDELAARTKPK